MSYLDDAHMAQIERAAERREQARTWAEDKPTKLGPPAPLHSIFVGIFRSLGMPQRESQTNTPSGVFANPRQE